jgi:histidinol-phosphate aminotransferase
MSLRDRVKSHIAELVPYQPGKPIEELEREFGIQDSVKLASNENPLGPSKRAVAALHAEVESAHLYPDGACFELRAALSDSLGVQADQLAFGCGSSEILELVAKAFVGEGDEVVYEWPSFAMYPIVVRGSGGTPVEVPLDADLNHDLDAMAAAVGPRTQAVIVCNPNNPTGTSIGAEAFDRFVASLPEDVILVIDEAYGEYARRPDFPDALSWVARRPATLVLRTFSKIYGLAGLRLGYGIGGAELIGFLDRARHPFNVNRLAEAAAVAALGDTEHVERARRTNCEGADYLSRELSALGMEVWPSDANFLLVRAGEGVYEPLLREGIIVRPTAAFGLPDCIRVTIGLPEENERLVKALRKIRESRRASA